MVDIAPFRALRYAAPVSSARTDSSALADISASICPPYDVISPSDRETLVKRSPTNAVQLELPSANGSDRYSHAADVLRHWRDDAVLQQDRQPAYYLLETTFRINDAFAPITALKRYGVLSALRLETPGKGAVHPHEKTLPKAKEDRLNLLNATRTNVSPIFGLFFDTKNEWQGWVDAATKQPPVSVGKENDGLEHRLWKIDDPGAQQALRGILDGKDLYIADGHHRYEVAWAYHETRLQAEPSAPLDAGWRRVMAYVCPMEEKGLVMLPTHRLVKSPKTIADWKAHLAKFFDLQPAGSVRDVVNALVAPSKSRLIGFATKEGNLLLSLKKDISIDLCMQNRPPALRELDVVLLHDAAMAESCEPNFLQQKEVIYSRDLNEIQSHIADPSWVAFLLRSPGVESLARVAGAHEVMPPKTTYFYPKVPTGFTLMPLEQKIS